MLGPLAYVSACVAGVALGVSSLIGFVCTAVVVALVALTVFIHRLEQRLSLWPRALVYSAIVSIGLAAALGSDNRYLRSSFELTALLCYIGVFAAALNLVFAWIARRLLAYSNSADEDAKKDQ